MMRYLHLRYPHEFGVAAKGGLTVAYTVVDMEKPEPYRMVTYAIAKCHKNDVFVKRVGRDKAAGRFKAKNFDDYGRNFKMPIQASYKDIHDTIIKNMKNNGVNLEGLDCQQVCEC